MTTDRPRILLLTTSYLPLIGGSELAIHHIAKRLPQYRFDIVTGRYSAAHAREEEVGTVRIFRAGGRLARMWVGLPKLLLPIALLATALRLLRSERSYVLMHAYQASHAGFAAAVLKRFYPKLPFVVTLQEGKDLDRQDGIRRAVRGWIVRSADVVTVISSYLAQYVSRLARGRVVKIPNGVDVAMFSPKEASPSHDVPVVVSVSRLVPKNGLDTLLRAAGIVRRSGATLRIVLVGDGPLRHELEGIAREEGVADIVSFRETVSPDKIPALLQGTDIFARFSKSEGLGSAFLEAMAAGLPVLATNVGGIPDIVVHERTGLLCPPNDPAAAAAALQRLLGDAELRARYAAAGRDRAVQGYSWDSVAQAMGTLYDELRHDA